MTPTEYKQKRLDEAEGIRQDAARWKADWYNSVAVAAQSVPPPTIPTEETLMQRLARWAKQDEDRRRDSEADLERFNAEFKKWWDETHPLA